MMSTLASAELFVLALFCCAFVATGLASMGVPYALRAVACWEATRRHRALLLLSFAPLLGTAMLMLAALGPSILSLFEPTWDHCLAHDGRHAHLCFLHWPTHAPHAVVWGLSAALLIWLGSHIASYIGNVRRASAQARVLTQTCEPPSHGATVLEGPTLVCAAIGLLTPRVFVSRSLLRDLSETQREALFAHEASHALRRDALVRLVARAAAAMYPGAARCQIDDALELAAEQACDEYAARMVGDRVAVAETILRVERAFGDTLPTNSPVAVGMYQGHLASRIESLLAEPRVAGSTRAVLFPIALASGVLCLGSEPVHHAIEWSLSMLLS